jgi:hypothetical protein
MIDALKHRATNQLDVKVTTLHHVHTSLQRRLHPVQPGRATTDIAVRLVSRPQRATVAQRVGISMVRHHVGRVVGVRVERLNRLRQLQQALLVLVQRPPLFANRDDNVCLATDQRASLHGHTGSRVHGGPVSTPVNDDLARRMGQQLVTSSFIVKVVLSGAVQTHGAHSNRRVGSRRLQIVGAEAHGVQHAHDNLQASLGPVLHGGLRDGFHRSVRTHRIRNQRDDRKVVERAKETKVNALPVAVGRITKLVGEGNVGEEATGSLIVDGDREEAEMGPVRRVEETRGEREDARVSLFRDCGEGLREHVGAEDLDRVNRRVPRNVVLQVLTVQRGQLARGERSNILCLASRVLEEQRRIWLRRNHRVGHERTTVLKLTNGHGRGRVTGSREYGRTDTATPQRSFARQVDQRVVSVLDPQARPNVDGGLEYLLVKVLAQNRQVQHGVERHTAGSEERGGHDVRINVEATKLTEDGNTNEIGSSVESSEFLKRLVVKVLQLGDVFVAKQAVGPPIVNGKVRRGGPLVHPNDRRGLWTNPHLKHTAGNTISGNSSNKSNEKQ